MNASLIHIMTALEIDQHNISTIMRCMYLLEALYVRTVTTHNIIKLHKFHSCHAACQLCTMSHNVIIDMVDIIASPLCNHAHLLIYATMLVITVCLHLHA